MNMYSARWLILLATLSSAKEVQRNEKTKWNVDREAAAVRLRLDREALEHIRRVFMRVLQEELPQAEDLKVFRSFPPHNTITVDELKFTDLTKARYSLFKPHPPNKVIVAFEDFDFSLRSEFIGTQGGLRLPGHLKGDVEGMTIAAMLDLFKAKDDTLYLIVSKCAGVTRNATFALDAFGPLAGAAQPHMPKILKGIADASPWMLCAYIEKAVGKISEALFGPKQLLVPFSKLTRAREAVFTNLTLDMTLFANGTSTEDYVEIPFFGTFYYKPLAPRTPFNPRVETTFVELLSSEKPMLRLLISEHTINTALYHAYTQDRLSTTLDEFTDRKRWARFLRTSCSSSGRWSDAEDLLREYCLGSILPVIAEERPNEILIVDIEMSALPVAAIDQIQLSVNIRERLTVRAGNKSVLVADYSALATIEPRLEGNRISGSVKVPLSNLRLRESSLTSLTTRTIQEAHDELAEFHRQAISRWLEEGFILPHSDTLYTLTGARLIMHDGFIEVKSDFELREKALRPVISELLNSK